MAIRQFVTLTRTYSDITGTRAHRDALFALHTLDASPWAESDGTMAVDVIPFVGNDGQTHVSYTEYYRYWPKSDAMADMRLIQRGGLQAHYGQGFRVNNTMGWTFRVNVHCKGLPNRESAFTVYRKHKAELDARLYTYQNTLRQGGTVQTFVRGEREERMYGGGKRPLKPRKLPVPTRKGMNKPKGGFGDRIGKDLMGIAMLLSELEPGTEKHTELSQLFRQWSSLLDPAPNKGKESPMSATQWESLRDAQSTKAATVDHTAIADHAAEPSKYTGFHPLAYLGTICEQISKRQLPRL